MRLRIRWIEVETDTNKYYLTKWPESSASASCIQVRPRYGKHLCIRIFNVHLANLTEIEIGFTSFCFSSFNTCTAEFHFFGPCVANKHTHTEPAQTIHHNVGVADATTTTTTAM